MNLINIRGMVCRASSTVALSSTIVAIAACSAGDGAPGEAVGRTNQALTVGQDFCVFGSAGVQVGDRAVAQGLAGAGTSLDVGNDARINGTTLVHGNGVLHDRASVTGALTLSGTLTRGSGAVVTGRVRTNTPVTLPSLAIPSVPAPEEPSTQEIGPGANTVLAGGGYGDLIIHSRSTVRLSGTYDVRAFIVEPDVTLVEDPPGSGIQINSKGAITLGDRSVLKASDPAGVTLYSLGAIAVGSQASITGILDAPAGGITVGSRTTINGCAGGKQLSLAPDSRVVSTNPNATLVFQD